jgi:hydroxyacylglutathione hydrolase
MILEKLVVSPVEANCYIVGCDKILEGIIIDPGAEGDKILEKVKKLKLKIKYIINTHAHIDHIGANKYLKDALGAGICMHEEDIKFLKDPSLNLSDFAPPGSQDEFLPFPNPDITLYDGLQLNIGNLKALILHTPGHTPGGISVVINNCVFTGDTLFLGSIGNTSFSLSNYNLLIKSIKNKLLSLPDDFIVYPGHGSPTTIGKEKKENPYLK